MNLNQPYYFIKLLLLTSFFLSSQLASASPKIERGILNCMDWDFEKNGNIELRGEWEFYWKQFISPKDFEKGTPHIKPSFATFPELWTNLTIDNKNLSSKGYATYRLHIKNDTLLPIMAIEMPDVYSAYRLWLNGKIIAENGDVGKNSVESTPYWMPLTIPIKLEKRSNEIILQISNFSHSKGGISKTPRLGINEQLTSKRERELAYSLLLTGSLLMGGLFFLGLFLFGKSDKVVLIFALFCLVYSYRVVGTDLYVLHSLVNWSWEVTIRLEYLTLFLSITLFVEFIRRLFPDEVYLPAMRFFQGFSLLLMLITIVSSPLFFTSVVNYYLITLAIYLVYGCYVFILATIRKREGAIYALTSAFILFGVFILVIGAYFNVLPYLPFVYFTGYLLFFFFQSLILSYRFAETFKRATEAAEQGAKAKADFLATMSHEIRTPMNGIIGMTTLLAQTELTEEQQEYAETIRVSGEGLVTIINEILDYSKIDSGKMELEEQPFELEVAVEDILDLLSVKANIKQLNLWYHIDRKIAPLIVGDVTRLKQILTNLIGNAIKFTDKGQITTEVTLVQETSKTIELQFKVIDTGIGIPPSKQHDLFAEFKQVDSSTTRKYGGTGLGLTISQRLVKMMQGQIWVESDGLKGSTFIFTAKFKKNNNELQQAYYQDEMAIMSQKNILLIADNDRLIDLIKYHTDYWQSNLTIATSVSEMLAMVQNQYDLILIYERLRGVSGIALEKRIRFTAQGKHIPIIILSTTHFESSKANHHVYTAFVNNPLKISNLRHSIKTLVLPKNKAEHYKEILKKETEILGQKLPLKILIAEDHPINQRLVLFLLKKQGYQADAVGNGQEAIEAIEQQRYDILFMDVQMPELDGLEATRRIVKKYPNIPDRPVIIAMTANAMQGDRERCLGAGMDDYVSKPLKPGIVVEMLTKWGTRLKIKE